MWVAAGEVLIVVERFSPWLYLCAPLGALFIGFGKQRGQLLLMQRTRARRAGCCKTTIRSSTS
jgi:hypothetical protein